MRLSAQERSPGGIHVRGSQSAPAGAQDPLHGRYADAVTEPAEFAVDSAVSPAVGFSRASLYRFKISRIVPDLGFVGSAQAAR